jgi:hypothetical protein
MFPDLATLGRWLLWLGLALAVVGGGLWLAGRAGWPLGRLPGDLRFESGNLSCLLPLGTSILFSLILTLLLNVLLRWLGK